MIGLLNACRSNEILETATELKLASAPQHVLDNVLCQVTSPANVAALAAIGLCPSTLTQYDAATVWGKYIDPETAEWMVDDLLRVDLEGSSLLTFKSCIESLNVVLSHMEIGTVYWNYHCNVCATMFKLESASSSKVVASVALLNSLYIPSTPFHESFDRSVDHLHWGRSVTRKGLSACLASAMKRGFCELVRRTLKGVVCAAKYKGLDLKSVVSNAFVEARGHLSETTSDAAGCILMYEPGSKLSWFPGAVSHIFNAFRGNLNSYQECQKQSWAISFKGRFLDAAVRAGAIPPVITPLFYRRPQPFWPSGFYDVALTIIASLNRLPSGISQHRLPHEASLFIIEHILNTHKL